jgi:hypothetical protein
LAIVCGKETGPRFGKGELLAYEPFNGENNCWSFADFVGYDIGMDSESRSMLTNLECE